MQPASGLICVHVIEIALAADFDGPEGFYTAPRPWRAGPI